MLHFPRISSRLSVADTLAGGNGIFSEPREHANFLSILERKHTGSTHPIFSPNRAESAPKSADNGDSFCECVIFCESVTQKRRTQRRCVRRIPCPSSRRKKCESITPDDVLLCVETITKGGSDEGLVAMGRRHTNSRSIPQRSGMVHQGLVQQTTSCPQSAARTALSGGGGGDGGGGGGADGGVGAAR